MTPLTTAHTEAAVGFHGADGGSRRSSLVLGTMRVTASGMAPMVRTRTVGPTRTTAKEATVGIASGKATVW